MNRQYRKRLVSIIVPCYNGEKYISRLLDSILLQNYSRIETIVVNDGSSDDSERVIKKYIHLFADKKLELRYIFQTNSGQAAAVNKGLKYATGEYLIWPDCDDFFSKDYSISHFVQMFEHLDSSYGVVRCNGEFVDEETLETVCLRTHKIKKDYIFQEFFTGMESVAGAGLYMHRMCAFDDLYPNREIYHEMQPQNFQMILPVMYKYKCYTIEENLYKILLRKESHSRREKTFEQHLAGFNGFLTLISKSLDVIDMGLEERAMYDKLCIIHNSREKMELAFLFNRKREALEYANLIVENGGRLNFSTRVKLCILSVSSSLFCMLMKIKRKVNAK